MENLDKFANDRATDIYIWVLKNKTPPKTVPSNLYQIANSFYPPLPIEYGRITFSECLLWVLNYDNEYLKRLYNFNPYYQYYN